MYDFFLIALCAALPTALTLGTIRRRVNDTSNLRFSIGYRLFWTIMLIGTLWSTWININGGETLVLWVLALMWLFVVPITVHAFVFRSAVNEIGLVQQGLIYRKRVLWQDVTSIQSSSWGLKFTSHDQTIHISITMCDGILNILDVIPEPLIAEWRKPIEKMQALAAS